MPGWTRGCGFRGGRGELFNHKEHKHESSRIFALKELPMMRNTDANEGANGWSFRSRNEVFDSPNEAFDSRNEAFRSWSQNFDGTTQNFERFHQMFDHAG